MILANSLLKGFQDSTMMGQTIVLLQILASVVMVAVAFGKASGLSSTALKMKRFSREFSAFGDVLGYYLQRRPASVSGIEGIYKDVCERLIKLAAPDMRALIAGRQSESAGGTSLTAREIELVRGTCEHRLDEEIIKVEHGMSIIATIVAIAPMLGLLGTVWGVLDAFAVMGTAASANLATIAPSISSALVTTVIGLLVAFPGIIIHTSLNAKIRRITSDLEGFADELTTRIACEFQGRAA